MAPYNDKYCISCANRSQVRGVSFCKVKQCKRIPTKRKHVNAVEFIPDAGVLIVRTRYYPEVKEVILAHRDEAGRTFKEEKTTIYVEDTALDGQRYFGDKCTNCGRYGDVRYSYCPWCGAKVLEASGGEE